MSGSPRVAIVTGGGTGIGKAAAFAIADLGFSVIISGRRWQPLADAVQEGGEGRAIHAVVADVSNPRSVQMLFFEVRQRFGRLDLLFNNAGRGGEVGSIEEVSLEDWQAAVTTNLTGAFLCTQQAIRIMKDQEPQGGRIINNGSISAHSPRPLSAPYTATKHGLTGLTKATSLDGRRYHIACGQIDIGNAATARTDKVERGALQSNGVVMVEPRMDVENVARTISLMASLPLDSNIQFVTIAATNMPFIGRG